MLKNNGISILISGDQQSGKALAAILINKALTDSGFCDVNMVSESGKPIAPLNVVPSILDIMKEGAPGLFQTRVVIQEVKTRSKLPNKERLMEEDAPAPVEIETSG